MDEGRIKNLFGNRTSAQNSSRVGGPLPYSEQLPASGQGDIVLQPESKRNKKLLIGAIIGGVVLIIVAVVAIVVITANAPKSSPKSDGGATDRAVLELMNKTSTQITDIQSLMVNLKQNDYKDTGISSNELKDSLHEVVQSIQTFKDNLDQTDISFISSEYARKNLTELKKALESDLPKFNQIVYLYDLFYDYANNDYSPQYKTKITALNDSNIDKILEKFDQLVTEANNDPIKHYGFGVNDYALRGIITDIVNIYLDDDYPNIWYDDYIGNIYGEIEK